MISRASEVRATIAAHWLPSSDSSGELGSVTLHAHQRSAVERLRALLAEHRGALLADEAGLGKTYVAAAMMRESARALLVLPAALRGMWKGALEAAGVRATMISYSALSRGTIPDGDFDLVVLDEAHHARTSHTLRYAVLASLTARSQVLLITATPVHNRRTELAALFALFLGARAYTLSDAELARLIVRREREDVAAAVPLPDAPAPIRIEVRDDSALLGALLALPPPVPPSDGGVGGVLLAWSLLRQWSSSRAALAGALRRRIARGIALESALEEGRHPDRRELRAWSAAEDAIQLAFPLLVAGPAAEPHALLALVRAHLDAVRALLARVRAGESCGAGGVDDARAQSLREISERHQGEKVLAFSQYADTVHAMYERLRDVGAVAALTSRGARIAGGQLTRGEALSRFAPRASGVTAPSRAERIDLLLTTDLASEGLNLHDASVVVHLDLPWTPARLEQRVARSRRIGALHARTWSYALAPPADAERVLEVERRLRRKLKTMEEVIGSTGAVLPECEADSEPVEASSTQLRERVARALRGWSDRNLPASALRDSSTSAEPRIACVTAPRRAILALALDGAQPILAAALDDADLTEDSRVVLAAIEVAAGPDAAIDDRLRANAVARAERWLAHRAGAHAGDTLAWRSASRRVALRRIAGLASRAPLHRRALLAPLAMAARRVVSAPYALGAERVLDELASAPLPDEAWLRALASFGAMHGTRERESGSARLVAMIIAG